MGKAKLRARWLRGWERGVRLRDCRLPACRWIIGNCLARLHRGFVPISPPIWVIAWSLTIRGSSSAHRSDARHTLPSLYQTDSQRLCHRAVHTIFRASSWTHGKLRTCSPGLTKGEQLGRSKQGNPKACLAAVHGVQ